MVQKTSWEGQLTRKLRAKGKKGFYTRYANRRTKKGLQLVYPKETHLEVRDISGRLIAREPKYHHYNSYEKSANQIYNMQIKRKFKKIK